MERSLPAYSHEEPRYGGRWASQKNRSHPGKSAARCCHGPFFDLRPAIPHPTTNCLLVALPVAMFGSLPTPAQLTQEFPDVTRVIDNPKLAANDMSFNVHSSVSKP